MAKRPRYRGKRRSNRSRSKNRRPKEQKVPSLISNVIKPIPTEATDGVVLLDQEDFYGIYLDLVMFNMAKPDVIKIPNSKIYANFKKYLAGGSYQSNTYIIDETFGWGVVDMAKLVEMIRENDKKAYVIGLTAMDKADMLTPEIFDAVNVKSRKLRDDNVVFSLTEQFGVEYIESNTEENYLGVAEMERLLKEGDDHPQKIIRDKGNGPEGTLL